MSVYVSAFSLAAALMLVSIAVEPPARYWIWALALTLDVGTPLTVRRRIELIPIHRSHIPERIGLFTIIVLGETVIAVVVILAVRFWWGKRQGRGRGSVSEF